MTDRARVNSSAVTAVPGFGFHKNPSSSRAITTTVRSSLNDVHQATVNLLRIPYTFPLLTAGLHTGASRREFLSMQASQRCLRRIARASQDSVLN